MAVILIYNLANLCNFHIFLIFSETNLIRKIQYKNLGKFEKIPISRAYTIGNNPFWGWVLMWWGLCRNLQKVRPTSILAKNGTFIFFRKTAYRRFTDSIKIKKNVSGNCRTVTNMLSNFQKDCLSIFVLVAILSFGNFQFF